MKNEDFGYMIEKERHSRFSLARKPFKIAAVLISLLCFVLITISAYYFVSHGQDEHIEIIESPTHEIKVRNKSDDSRIKNIDKTIYDNIVGNKKDDLNKKTINIIKAPRTAKPTKSNKNRASILNAEKDDSAKIAPGNYARIRKPYSRVQLAALKSKDSAYQYWSSLRKVHPKLFFQLKYFIQRADLGKRGIFYRLQIGDFRNQIKAEEFCIKFIAKTRKSRSDCIIVE
jgi:hypothetical protein